MTCRHRRTPFGQAARAQRQLAIVSSAVQRDARCKLTAEGFNEAGKHCCVVDDCYWREGERGGVGRADQSEARQRGARVCCGEPVETILGTISDTFSKII